MASEYDNEIEKYLTRLHKIAFYQRYVIIPALILMLLIECYQLYYYRTCGMITVVVTYVAYIVFSFYDSRRTFAKIMLWRLTR